MKFHNFNILITILFLILKIKGNYTITLEEQIIKNKLSNREKSEKYILISIKSQNSGKILFVSNFRDNFKKINLYLNSKQLFSQLKQSLNVYIKGNYVYYAEFILLNQTGSFKNNGEFIQISVNGSNYQINLIGGIFYSINNDFSYINIQGKNFIYYVNCHRRSDSENLDELNFAKINYINYFKKDCSNIDIFLCIFIHIIMLMK